MLVGAQGNGFRLRAFCLCGFGPCFCHAPLRHALTGQMVRRQEKVGRAAGPVLGGLSVAVLLWVCGFVVNVSIACVSCASHVEGE